MPSSWTSLPSASAILIVVSQWSQCQASGSSESAIGAPQLGQFTAHERYHPDRILFALLSFVHCSRFTQTHACTAPAAQTTFNAKTNRPEGQLLNGNAS